MRKLLFITMLMLSVVSIFAQDVDKRDVKKQFEAMTDSLTELQKDFLYNMLEDRIVATIDSVIDEGRYMEVLAKIDSLSSNWKYLTGREVPPVIYLKKHIILMELEEWEEMLQTTQECFSVHKENVPDKIAAILRRSEGMAFRNQKDYRKAIESYEKSQLLYIKLGDSNNQGENLCDMAYCYSQIDKQIMASELYNKGLDKYLEYFETTRSALLRDNFSVTDSYKKLVLDVFSGHLYNMAVFEQDRGDRRSMKDYLLMSAHCGSRIAQQEYERIFGH